MHHVVDRTKYAHRSSLVEWGVGDSLESGFQFVEERRFRDTGRVVACGIELFNDVVLVKAGGVVAGRFELIF